MSSNLSQDQAHALFDILTHTETYAEIQSFRFPNAIHEYGHPFEKKDGRPRNSPILQTLLQNFALPLPGLRSVSKDFWQKRCQGLVEEFGAAELSESYDKGTLGSRKTLATACSALIENPARGYLGGFPQGEKIDKDKQYDLKKAEDVQKGWEDFTQGLVYGDMIDELFSRAALTDQLEHHSSLVQAAHEYILVNVASFLHHTLILSPDGQYIVRILENAHSLTPYGLVRQTLRVGNAASMINGMVKLVLTKMSVTAVTNWMGWSNSSNDGMNLLQQILSTILSWDVAEFQKRLAKLEKQKDIPNQDQLTALKDHLKKPRDEHEKCRAKSRNESKSIITAIMESSSVDGEMSEIQHELAMRYYGILLSIRDREQLTQILCKHQPDLITQAIKDLVAAYEPIIRAMHNAADLSASTTDTENFISDLVKLSKVAKKDGDSSDSKDEVAKPPAVEDFVKLLKKHQGSLHRFLHQVVKNGDDLAGWFKDYATEAVSKFRVKDGNKKSGGGAGGRMTESLDKLVGDLSESERSEVLKDLDSHAEYLSRLKSSSFARMESILVGGSVTEYGPGMYLARWRSMLDETPITPAVPRGPLRTGMDKEVKKASNVTVDGMQPATVVSHGEESLKGKEKIPNPPDVSLVLDLLGEKFKKVLVVATE